VAHHSDVFTAEAMPTSVSSMREAANISMRRLSSTNPPKLRMRWIKLGRRLRGDPEASLTRDVGVPAWGVPAWGVGRVWMVWKDLTAVSSSGMGPERVGAWGPEVSSKSSYLQRSAQKPNATHRSPRGVVWSSDRLLERRGRMGTRSSARNALAQQPFKQVSYGLKRPEAGHEVHKHLPT